MVPWYHGPTMVPLLQLLLGSSGLDTQRSRVFGIVCATVCTIHSVCTNYIVCHIVCHRYKTAVAPQCSGSTVDHSGPNILLRYIRTNHHLYIVIASSIRIMVALKSQAIFDISFSFSAGWKLMWKC